MPFQILKRGKVFILKSPTREYKHKTLAKAKAQKRLLEDKDLKQKQSQKQTVKQVVTINVNQARAKRGSTVTRQIARPDKMAEPRVMMLNASVPTAEAIAFQIHAMNRLSSAPKTDIFDRHVAPPPSLTPLSSGTDPVPTLRPETLSYSEYDFDPRTQFIIPEDQQTQPQPIIESPSDSYGDMRVIELKAELRSRGLPISGKKADLIDRLRQYDR
jgi:hypothetical protein